jgi:magnesium transporter
MATASEPDVHLEEPIVRHVRMDHTVVFTDDTVGAALEKLRKTRLSERIIYFYAVDGDGRLVGVVPTRRLLMSRLDEKVSNIMSRDVISVPSSMKTGDALELFVMHRLLAFPVVDGDGKLAGVVDVNLFTEEIFDINERRSAEDAFQLIGVRLARGRMVSPSAGFRNRFPWLLCNIAGGIGCAFIAGMYQGLLDAVIILALFIPVVLALAESVSIQSMTITLQGFHERGVDWRNILRALRVEVLTATLLGVACGGLVATVALVWKREVAVSLAIWLSITCSIITACLLGVLLPAVVRAFRGDPRIAAGPVVLATADIATLLFYFSLSGWLLGRA